MASIACNSSASFIDSIWYRHRRKPSANRRPSVCQVYERTFSKEMIDALNGALINLTRLRSLNIYHRDVEGSPLLAAPLQLAGCSNICKLVLFMRLSREDRGQIMITFPDTLTHLELINSLLHQDPMPILEKLPNLQCLKLGMRCFIGKEMVCSAGGFPNLRSLTLDWLPSLKRMMIGEGVAMSRLRRMTINGCDEWETFPDALSSIKSLQELYLRRMPLDWTERVVMGGVDHHKLKHIPLVTIHRDYVCLVG